MSHINEFVASMGYILKLAFGPHYTLMALSAIFIAIVSLKNNFSSHSTMAIRSRHSEEFFQIVAGFAGFVHFMDLTGSWTLGDLVVVEESTSVHWMGFSILLILFFSALTGLILYRLSVTLRRVRTLRLKKRTLKRYLKRLSRMVPR